MSEQPILNRTLGRIKTTWTPHLSSEIDGKPFDWLKSRASAGMIFLAHADDGIVWGKGIDTDDRIVFPASGGFPQADLPQMGQPTWPALQMARLFDEKQEYFLWRVEEGEWQARHIQDHTVENVSDKPPNYFDESQVLWGTRVERNLSDGHFSLVADGEEGFCHAPPVTARGRWGEQVRGRADRRLRLHVRHYLEEDENTGWLRIAYSRLLNVSVEEEK